MQNPINCVTRKCLSIGCSVALLIENLGYLIEGSSYMALSFAPESLDLFENLCTLLSLGICLTALALPSLLPNLLSGLSQFLDRQRLVQFSEDALYLNHGLLHGIFCKGCGDVLTCIG